MEKSAQPDTPISSSTSSDTWQDSVVKSEISAHKKLRDWGNQTIDHILPILAFLSVPSFLLYAYRDATNNALLNHLFFYILFVVVLFWIAFWPKLSFIVKNRALITYLFVLGTYLFATVDPGSGEILLVSLSFLSMIFWGARFGMFTAIATILAMLVVSLVKTSGNISMLDAWPSTLIMAVIINYLIVSTLNFILKRLEEMIQQSSAAQHEIENRIQAERNQRLSIQATVQEYVDFMSQVSQGKLSSRMGLNEKTESNNLLIVLGQQLNETLDSLQNMINQIHEAAANLGSASAEILAATTQQSSGATEQSAAITQTTSTVEEIKTISEQFINRSQEMTVTAQHSVDISRSGEQVITDTIISMGHIKSQVNSIAENILALSERTQQIGDIITTVNDIASQSNILALNAAVEAARAGEHGLGFGVVAEEVRNLAIQSRQATAQVRSILMDIQRAINTTVMVTEEGTKVVEQGVSQTEQAGKVIQQLAEVIDKSSLQAIQMAAAGQQQTTGVEQIAGAMQSLKLATAQGLASTRQTEKAAQNLNSLAKELSAVIAVYQA
jgi:methyl-accepting chemotaxis protein